MTGPPGNQTMIAPLRSVVVKRPLDAFKDDRRIDAQWRELGFRARPDLDSAQREHQRLVDILDQAGCQVLCLPPDDRTGLDSIYTHDPALLTERGMVLLKTGKVPRRGESAAMAESFEAWNLPVRDTIGGEATAEGGDLVWLDPRTLLAGRSFRTSQSGVSALRALLEPDGVQVLSFDLPCHRGPGDCLHLQSFLSLIDADLAVVYPPLMPVALFQLLRERGVRLIEVPPQEYQTQGCNVLTLAPRTVVVLDGNPVTRSLLETAGCQVHTFAGDEISHKGCGGPTCLTRPVLRSWEG